LYEKSVVRNRRFGRLKVLTQKVISMKTVKIGVIGCGVIGSQHLQSAMELPMTIPVAVADIDVTRAEEIARQFKVPTVHGSGEALLDNPDIEAVVLALTTSVRQGLAVKALRRGKHVLIEKPAAANQAELEIIASAAREHPELVVAFSSARYHFLPHSRAVTDFIATGALGELRSIHFRGILPPGPATTTPPPAWRVNRAANGGGILVNWGIYELDYIFGLTGWSLKPLHVLANCWGISPQFQNYVAPGSDAEEHFSSFITCENGTVISFERGERVASCSETTARMVGSKGSLNLSMFPEIGKKIVFHNSAENQGVWDEVIWEGDEDFDMHRVGIIRDFAEAILEKRQPQTNVERAMILQKLTDAIYRSAEAGLPVAFADRGF